MILRHVVLFTFSPETPEPRQRELVEGMRAFLAAQVHGLRWTCVPDAGLVEGNASVSVAVDFATAEDFHAFQGDPVHLEVIAQLRPHVVGRAASQGWLGGEAAPGHAHDAGTTVGP